MISAFISVSTLFAATVLADSIQENVSLRADKARYKITYACDDWSALYINGERVSQSFIYSEPVTYVTKLSPGDVVGVMGGDFGGTNGIKVEIKEVGPGGQVVRTGDDDFKITYADPNSEIPLFFFLPQFDAAAYPPPVVVEGVEVEFINNKAKAVWLDGLGTETSTVYLRYTIKPRDTVVKKFQIAVYGAAWVYLNGNYAGAASMPDEVTDLYLSVAIGDVISVRAGTFLDNFGVITAYDRKVSGDLEWKQSLDPPEQVENESWGTPEFSGCDWEEATLQEKPPRSLLRKMDIPNSQYRKARWMWGTADRSDDTYYYARYRMVVGGENC